MMVRARLFLLYLSLSAAHDTSGDVAWLAANAKESGVVVMPSGLQYKVIATGDAGGPHPTRNQKCKCHYTGSLVDGSVFDSSRKRGTPATFAPSGVIGGWTEALQLMRPGDRWQLFIPSQLGYGSRGMGRTIPGGAVLIFDLELLDLVESGSFTSTLDAIPQWAVIVGVVVLVGAILYMVGGPGQKGKSVSASHILVADEKQCKAMKDLLDHMAAEGKTEQEVGAKFAELASDKSTCPSGKSGGKLGTFAPGQMVPAFDKVCWSAPIGQVQGPVQTQFGFHLILVTARVMPEDKGE